MSTFSATCDALMADLVANVAGLTTATQHKYEAWLPEERRNDGKRHVAVYPSPDLFDTVNTDGAPVGYHFRVQAFEVLVWEPSGVESPRQVSDEVGAAAFLDLYEAVLGRFYVTANQSMAGSWKQWFAGAEVPSRSSQVRYFRIAVNRNDVLPFA